MQVGIHGRVGWSRRGMGTVQTTPPSQQRNTMTHRALATGLSLAVTTAVSLGANAGPAEAASEARPGRPRLLTGATTPLPEHRDVHRPCGQGG